MSLPNRSARMMPENASSSLSDNLLSSLLHQSSDSSSSLPRPLDDSLARYLMNALGSTYMFQQPPTTLVAAPARDLLAIARPTPIRPSANDSASLGLESLKRKHQQPDPLEEHCVEEQHPGTKYIKIEPPSVIPTREQAPQVSEAKAEILSHPQKAMQDVKPALTAVVEQGQSTTRRNRRTKKQIELARMQEFQQKLSKLSLDEIARLCPVVKRIQLDLQQILKSLLTERGELAICEARAHALFSLQKFEPQYGVAESDSEDQGADGM
ncbi:hypothetical protein GUITHDRAFT_148493 [Guillardia theta CCMP2712]|uniref:Uncharacterized protein n=1 Tax=Guillardia theta (strain CCMP2712) TaxID=905079 RepID=L1I9Q6_GUITC|nr:hypothetical protein GUITHDRAFT_148493 [Guillardia theta CCMP2712]EKX32639.1 hypothetical protein GUITHDRAFT_148493 [Guillardia theta CCMP2712]|eukprot:XP_005819619.1 hypothetical protein GUITHDRAFT_148493 [Guillardia theta CCMP2712]